MASNVISHPLTKHRDSRIMGQSWAWVTDPLRDWVTEGRSMAALAWALVQTDPYCRAMLESRLTLTHGSSGLRFRSSYQMDDSPETTDTERQRQRQITSRVDASFSGTWIDAGRQMTRAEVERQIDTNAIVSGDGFAVRLFKPNRPGSQYATCWRVIASDRVCNPNGISDFEWPGKPDDGDTPPKSHTIYQGIELDADHQPAALWIQKPTRKGYGYGQCKYIRVPYWTAGGQRNVIHCFHQIRSGQMRGFSEFAPMFVHAAQLAGVAEAHVVAKRAQACITTLIRTSDPDRLAKAERQGARFGPNSERKPGLTAFIGEDDEIVNLDTNYQGSDYQTFVDSMVRPMTAAWGLPWQFVLAQLTNANLASSRAALDQAERAATSWQDSRIEHCTKVIDASIIAEDLARRRLPVKSLERACKGYHLRPRTWSTDRVKESVAAKNWFELGESPTSIFAKNGLDFEEQIRQKAQDIAFMEAQGVTMGELMQPAPEPEPAPQPAIDETQEIEVEDED